MITVAITKFKNILGKDIVCRLKSANAVNIPLYEFVSSGSPLHITSGSNTATETPILTSSAELMIENIEPFRAMNFMTASPRERMLEVEYDEIIIWTGYMVPDQWYENFSHTPYPSRFTFIDGLALLHHEKYVGDDGTYLRGRVQDVMIINRCLRSIGLNREFVDQINIFDVSSMGDTFQDGTLSHHIKDQEAFRDLTCYEVLSQILVSYKSRIEYYNNRYYISRIDNTDNTVYSVFWRPLGVAAVTITIIGRNWQPNRVQITPGNRKINRFCWQETSQSIEKIPGWKSFSFTQIYGRKESMLARHTFENDDWTVSGALKNWNVMGVDKVEVEGMPAACFVAPSPLVGRSPSASPSRWTREQVINGFMSQITLDSYSPENVTEGNWEQFILELDTQAGTFQYVFVGTYYGPRSSSGSTVRGETFRVREAGVFNAVKQFTIGVRSSPNAHFGTDLVFHVSRGGLLGRTLELGSTLIFRDSVNIPKPFLAGIVYTIVDIIGDTENYWFRVHDEFPPTFPSPYIPIDISAKDQLYQVSFWFVVIPCYIQLLQGDSITASLGLDGMWGNDRKYLFLEVQQADVDGRRKFGTGTMSEMSPMVQTFSRVLFRMEKPRDTINKESRDSHGSWFVYAVRLFLADVPEKYEKDIPVNPMNTRTGEVTLHFGETPIKTNFANNNLKFFNNFYSLTTTSAPGLQYHHGAINTVNVEVGVYGFLYNRWATDNIANTKIHGWRVSTHDDVLDLSKGWRVEDMSTTGYFWAGARLLKSPRVIGREGHPGWIVAQNVTLGYDFNILPAGVRGNALGAPMQTFHNLGQAAVLWLGEGNGAWVLDLHPNNIQYLSMSVTDSRNGMSVRLCRNLLPGEGLLVDGVAGTPYIGNDGKTYPTVKIHNRMWIGEHLRETKTNTGMDIPLVVSQTDWEALNSSAYCHVNNTPEMSFRIVEVPNEKLYKSSLRDMVINFYKRLYLNSRLSLSGVVNSNSEMTPFGKILQERHTGRDYIRMETIWDVHRNTFRGVWHELTKTMEDGFVRRGSYGRAYNKKQYN